MSLDREVDLIRQIPILSRLSPAAQKMLCFASERVFYGAGETVFRQGDGSDAAYVIIEGSVDIVIATSAGPLRINTVERYGTLGETGMFGDLPRSATAIAVEPLEMLRISRDVFHQVIHCNPDAAQRLISVLAQRLANTTEQLSDAVICQAG